LNCKLEIWHKETSNWWSYMDN